ncbi:hypothetical protein RB195_020545 [Necator americanus]|uniref:Phlebovirus glycoprotein G2 fusion domain-containing protein n=1 Tax=Necator americanus TaxID=51031 RepID=A0ABR1CMW1_NECAM
MPRFSERFVCLVNFFKDISGQLQVVCKCRDDDVETSFSKLENVLPFTRQQVRFSQHPYYGVVAKVDQDISAEIILNMKGIVDDFITVIRDDVCTIESTQLTGCYQCKKGARATVTCLSTFYNISALYAAPTASPSFVLLLAHHPKSSFFMSQLEYKLSVLSSAVCE